MSEVSEKKVLDAKLVNALIKSTQDVLGTMANTAVSVKEVRPQESYVAGGDISALIGITGEGGEGMVALSFPIKLANLIVSRLIGTSAETISAEDRSDGIGELVNMISGNTKTSLSTETNSNYRLSLPSIILGSGHEISASPKNCPYLCIVFEAEQQTFSLQVSFKFTN